MDKFLKTLLICSVLFLPQCGKKQKNTPTLISNHTSENLKIEIQTSDQDHDIILKPNATQSLDLPNGKSIVTARIHKNSSYLKTGILKEPIRIKPNRNMIISGEDPKYLNINLKHHQ